MQISNVPAVAGVAEDTEPPNTIVDIVPVTATSVIFFLSELTAVSATYGTVIGAGTKLAFMYGVACTDRMEVNSAFPPTVPSTVGYAVAAPLPPDTATVPYQVPIVVGETGAPVAAVEKSLDPLKTFGLLSRS